MKEIRCHENYPLWIVLLSNIVSLTIYATGAFVVYNIGWIWLILYVLYIAGLEIRLLKRSCVNCHYYGKVCAFGKGKLCRLFFKKGDPNKFKQDKITWKDMVPDLMVSLIPIVAGTIILLIDFNWLILSMVLLLLVVSSLGNGLIRGFFACKYCRQREIGCPAEQLFNKNKSKT
ncbi:hypothetical protein ACFLWF_00745 [Chloroflexota bacterium]